MRLRTTAIQKKHLAAAIVSGLLLTGAFPDWDLAWLAWLALVPLILAAGALPAKDSFLVGLLSGLVHYLSLMYWLVHTMQTYGGLPYSLSVGLLGLLSAYLSLYPGAFAAALAYWTRRPLLMPLMAATLWAALEYVRSFFLSGFPWGLLGYTQYRQLQLIQISDILGVYGISFWVMLSNATLALTVCWAARLSWQQVKISPRMVGGSALMLAFCSALMFGYGHRRLQTIQALLNVAPKAKVAVIQGNIAQDQKWDPAFQRHSTEKYVRLSQKAAQDHPALVVWPETATPFYFLFDPGLTRLVLEGIQATGNDYLIGSPSFARSDAQIAYFNSAYLLDANGNVSGKYDKAHLVPFGEYVPFKKWLPFLGKMVAQVGDFNAGPRGHCLTWGERRLGVQICYEIIFPPLARAMVNNDADLLVNITNDAWYGRSSAPYQHFSMTVLRAVENRRALVRSANTGISGFVDPTGRILAASPLFEEDAVLQAVPFLTVKSFYTRYGDVFALLCLVVTPVLAYVGVRPPMAGTDEPN